MRARPAQAYATALEICCPNCGETYPSPNGSFFWTLDEAYTHLTGRTVKCDSCDEPMKLVMPSKAQISPISVTNESRKSADDRMIGGEL